MSWRVLKEWPRDQPATFGDHYGTSAAFWDESASDGETPQKTRVFDASGRLVLERASEGSGWFTQALWLTVTSLSSRTSTTSSGWSVWGPERNILPADLECSDGRWLHTRLDDFSGKNEKLKIAVLDTDTLS